MSEESRETGKTAQQHNIMAAKAVAATVRTTLGPKGMDKMLVDASGDITVTNDGVTILQEMHIEHPAAKMVVEIAKTQEDTVGDGTTTAVVLAGELLKNAESLLDQKVHPTMVAKGYRLAETKTQHVLQQIAQPVSLESETLLRNIAITAMTGKGAETNRGQLADLVVNAALHVQGDREQIKVQSLVGERAQQSELLHGLVLEKERVHPGMPASIENGKVALLNCPLEIRNTEIDAKIHITDPTQLNAFLEQEEQSLREMVAHIQGTGATVIFCQKGIDEMAQHFMAKYGIFAARRISKSDMEMLAHVTGGTIVNNWKELSGDDLGFAGSIMQQKYADDDMILISKCDNANAVTLLIRGATEHIAAEITRAVTDAVGDVCASIGGKIVAGAGSVEMELAKELRSYASELHGREQLAVSAFADALEVIPRTLAENAGLDPIDVLVALRAAHDAGQVWAGVNVFTGKVMDAWNMGVLEPLKIKTQALSSAAEVAEMILRIDDVILRGPVKEEEPSLG